MVSGKFLRPASNVKCHCWLSETFQKCVSTIHNLNLTRARVWPLLGRLTDASWLWETCLCLPRLPALPKFQTSTTIWSWRICISLGSIKIDFRTLILSGLVILLVISEKFQMTMSVIHGAWGGWCVNGMWRTVYDDGPMMGWQWWDMTAVWHNRAVWGYSGWCWVSQGSGVRTEPRRLVSWYQSRAWAKLWSRSLRSLLMPALVTSDQPA